MHHAKRARLDGNALQPSPAVRNVLSQLVTRALLAASAEVLDQHMRGDTPERQVRVAVAPRATRGLPAAAQGRPFNPPSRRRARAAVG
jgi:hypothetical protein